MNIQLIAEQIGRIHLTLETQDSFEVYGGTWLGAFEVTQTGTAQWTLTVREKEVAAAPLRDYKVYARQIATGREWEVLSGKILVSARTAAVPADKLAPVEYFVTVPVVDHDVDAVGSTIVQGIPGPQGPPGPKGDPGEGGMTSEERDLLNGAAQRDADNTFTASNTFTGSVDMSGASVTPPEGWNVGELTAEDIQAVAPIKWGNQSVRLGEGAQSEIEGTAVGDKAEAYGTGNVAVGRYARTEVNYNVALGISSRASGISNIAIGQNAVAANIGGSLAYYALALGSNVVTSKTKAITIGAQFAENVDGTNVSHTCTTEGTGSITIGAGANTLNNGSTESSNSVTIGCKALNQGADSVVIGAQAIVTAEGSVGMGAGAKTSKTSVAIGAGATAWGERNVAMGKGSLCEGYYCCVSVGEGATTKQQQSVAVGSMAEVTQGNAIAIGYQSKGWGNRSIALGFQSKASAKNAVAIGAAANVADIGAVVFCSTSEGNTHTQLYFSGANTPLANTYEDGEAMMGYVVRDSAGNVMVDAEGNAMVGTQKLSVLFPNNRGENAFTPAMLSLDEDWTPKPMFHPSDLDMPTEEPQEPEEYQPLPVWPIVEPEVPEDLPPHGEVEKS